MRNPFNRLAAWLLVISVSGAGTVVAQEEDTFDLFRPRLEIGAAASREKAFRDAEDPFIDPDSDTLGWRAMNLRSNIPLGGTRLDLEGRLHGHQFFAHGAIEGSRTQISFLQEDPVLYTGGLGFTALMLGRSRNLYAASLFASVAEEEDTLGSPDIRYTGLALGSVRRGAGILIYGGAFTYQLGRGLVLPVFGGWTQLSPNWSLGGAFPFLLRATYRSSRTCNLNLFLRVRGNRYGFRNDGEFPGQPEDLFLRVVEGRVGAEIGYSPSDQVTLAAEAGALVGRRLVFSDDDDEFISAELEPGGYLRVVLRFAFGETLFDAGLP